MISGWIVSLWFTYSTWNLILNQKLKNTNLMMWQDLQRDGNVSFFFSIFCFWRFLILMHKALKPKEAIFTLSHSFTDPKVSVDTTEIRKRKIVTFTVVSAAIMSAQFLCEGLPPGGDYKNIIFSIKTTDTMLLKGKINKKAKLHFTHFYALLFFA